MDRDTLGMHVAFVVGCLFIAALTCLLVMLLVAGPAPEPEPPTETVDTDTQVKADDPATWEAPVVVDEAPTSSSSPSDEGAGTEGGPVYTGRFVTTQPGDDRYQFSDIPGAYLEWRFTARYSYDNCLIPSGREVYYTGTTDHEASDSYKVDGYAAYSAYKLSTFVRLRGHSGSKLCNEEYALHFVLMCMEAGRDWETALAICELESTYGAASNLFGILDNRFDGRTIEGYCAYLHYYQVVNPGAMGYRGGHSNELIDVFTVYNDHQQWRDNVAELVAGIRGECY